MKSYSLFLILATFLFINCSKDDPKPEAKWVATASPSDSDLTDVEYLNDKFGLISGAFGTLFKTTDGGSTWEGLNVGVNHSFVKAFALSEDEFFTSRIGLYNTTDGGNTFNELGNLSDYSGTIFDMHFFDSNNGVIYKEGLILKITNGGQDWTVKYNEAGYASKMQFVSNSIGYVSGGITYDGYSHGEIHKTTDAGNTWTALNISSAEINTMYFINENTGYFSNFDNQLLKTTDGGQSFEIINNQLPSLFYDMIFVSDKKAYGVGSAGVFKTTDGGLTWTNEYPSEGEIFTAINKTPNRIIYAVGNLGTILKKS
ncbi:Uncharacterized protein SAMN03097699_0347 [Flavobacteriaceae bacterium MAR_2010_188]|nr:Uncharacterized protein SAMN03097699_0347 [Flavobacteriaceae bacterium MAR_2010_188]